MGSEMCIRDSDWRECVIGDVVDEVVVVLKDRLFFWFFLGVAVL